MGVTVRQAGVVEVVGCVYIDGLRCRAGFVGDLVEHGGERGVVFVVGDGRYWFVGNVRGWEAGDGGLMESSPSVAMAGGSDAADSDSELADGMWGCSGSGMTSPMGGAAASMAAIFFWCSACSEMRSSSSICMRNSLEARRNSAMSLPSWRASTGSFFGPKRRRARMNDEGAIAEARHM